MMTGLWVERPLTFCDSAACRLIGCSMNDTLRHRRASRGSARIRCHSSITPSTSVVLLVAVERGAVAAFDPVEDRSDAPSRSMSAVDVAAHLELEPAVAVGLDHLLERFRQAVVDARRPGLRR